MPRTRRVRGIRVSAGTSQEWGFHFISNRVMPSARDEGPYLPDHRIEFFTVHQPSNPNSSSTPVKKLFQRCGQTSSRSRPGPRLTSRPNSPVSYTHLRAHETDSYLV